MPSIAFICTANRCRSVMAHAIFVAEAARRRLSFETHSAGVCDFTDLPPVNDTVNTCLRHGTPVPKEESTWAGSLPLDSIDRFLVMERHHAEALIAEFGVSADRVTLLAEFDPRDRGQEIADPIALPKSPRCERLRIPAVIHTGLQPGDQGREKIRVTVF